MGESAGLLVVALMALGLGLAAAIRAIIPRHSPRSEVVTLSIGRAGVAVVLGLACIGLGASLRAGAESWSRNVVSHPSPGLTVTTHFDADRYEFLREVGAWSIGFGLAVLAVTIGVWVSRDSLTNPGSPDTDSITGPPN
jgi:hypothetical protein